MRADVLREGVALADRVRVPVPRDKDGGSCKVEAVCRKERPEYSPDRCPFRGRLQVVRAFFVMGVRTREKGMPRGRDPTIALMRERLPAHASLPAGPTCSWHVYPHGRSLPYRLPTLTTAASPCHDHLPLSCFPLPPSHALSPPFLQPPASLSPSVSPLKLT